MRAMKDSGIEWIGQIPQEWGTIRAKYVTTITNGSDPKTEGDIPVYGSGSGCFKTCGEYKEGPTVLLGRKGTVDIPQYITGNYWNVDTAFDVKTVEEQLDLEFYYFAATCFDYKYYTSTTTLPSMTQTNYGNMYIPFPPVDVQRHVVVGLKEKLSGIDALIAAKEKTNALLKERRQSIIYEAVTKGLNPDAPMKDSGIEWIGQIPENWSTVRVKYTGSYKSGNTITAADVKESGNFPVYGGNGLRGYTDEITHDGDHLLIGRQGALCGNVHMVSGKFWASEHAVVGTINANYAIRFLFYVLDVFDLNRLSTSAAQPGISVEQITGVVIPCPTFVEQQEIANMLDAKCAEVDELISANEATIQKLKEYRQSIIYEAVTGKIEI